MRKGLELDLRRILDSGLGPYWSYSTAERVLEKHPWAPYIGSLEEKKEALEYIKANRKGPSEKGVMQNKKTASEEYELLFNGGIEEIQKGLEA